MQTLDLMIFQIKSMFIFLTERQPLGGRRCGLGNELLFSWCPFIQLLQRRRTADGDLGCTD